MNGNNGPSMHKAVDTYYRSGVELWYVNEYDTGRAYGGPEEGGWWYNYGEFKRTIATSPSYAMAMIIKSRQDPPYQRKNNVDPDGYDNDTDWLLAGGYDTAEDGTVYIEPHEGKSYPSERPYYE